MLHGLLILTGVLSGSPFLNEVVYFAVSFWWLALGVVQFISPSKSALDSRLRLIGYHGLAVAYLVFVSGVTSPLIACWLLLLLAANTYFGKTGLRASMLTFVAMMGFDAIIRYDGDVVSIIPTITVLISVLFVGLVTISISRAQEVDKQALKRSQKQERLLHDRTMSIVNNLADAIISTDVNGIVKIYNAASLNLLDTNDSLNGHHIDEVLELTDLDGAAIEPFGLLRANKTVEIRDDIHYTLEDGAVLRLELTLSPIRSAYSRTQKSEPQEGYIIIMRDITKAKNLEEERDEFISVVSHELRTPITIAEGTISNVQLMMDRPNIAKPILKKSIDTAHDQVMFLAKMVNDLSTLSRAERGVADEQELMTIKDLSQRMYHEYSTQAEEKGLQFNLDVVGKIGDIYASRLYLEELLQNFITNAIKYTKEGSVTVTISQKQDTILFEISDTGIGISKSDQLHVFQKFYRSEDYRTRETGGTGIGLYVSAKLAQKLGTQINLKSRLNHGSTFSFSMPVARGDEDPAS